MKIRELPALFGVTFMIQFALLSPMALIPLYVQDLLQWQDLVAFYAGLAGSVNGFSNMAASPLLGRIGDKLGAGKILGICLIGSGLAFIPQALVHQVWELLAARFLLGLFMGGLLPSVYSLIRAYSWNSSTMALGSMLGPVIGGMLSGWITIRGVILVSAALLARPISGKWRKKRL